MQQTSDLDSTILRLLGQLKGCVARLAGHYCPSQYCGCSSVGRAPPCQGGRREFEPRHPLQPSVETQCKATAGARAPSVIEERRAQAVFSLALSNNVSLAKIRTTSLG